MAEGLLRLKKSNQSTSQRYGRRKKNTPMVYREKYFVSDPLLRGSLLAVMVSLASLVLPEHTITTPAIALFVTPLTQVRTQRWNYFLVTVWRVVHVCMFINH